MCENSNKMRIEKARVYSNEKIFEDIFEITIETSEIACKAQPGQFVNLYCNFAGRMLPRPLSISDFDKNEGLIKMVYAAIGEGTGEFSLLKEGDHIEVLGPLGTGFRLPEPHEKSIIVAGGVGTAPMIGLAKALSGDKKIFLGFKTKSYLVDRLGLYGDVYVATDDGSCGLKGNVIDLLNSEKPEGNVLYACGPKPMLKAVQTWTEEKNIAGQLSLEERMGCGIGTCVGCVVKIKDNTKQGWGYKKVCKDGPVFNSGEVIFS